MKQSEIRVVLVDDHQVVIDGLNAMLNSCAHLKIVGQARNGKEAIQAVSVLKPDVVLMDINMPELNGIESCRIIMQDHPDIKIIMLSMLKEYSMMTKALRQGAVGYVLKNEGRDELIKAINSVMIGKKYISEEFKKLEEQEHLKTANHIRISRRERQVLKLIVDEFTMKDIATKLFISQNTVIAHRKNLMMKLGAKNTAGLVRVAVSQGLIDD